MYPCKHIIFLQAAHTDTDERVLYHQAQTLRDAGHRVEIYGMHDYIQFTPKVADIYIVDTPKALWKVRRTSAKIIYDITEWYPSKKNLRNIRFGKIIKAIILFFANLWAGYKADAFIFGEEDKAKPFQWLFPRKKNIFLPYYPNLDYIHPVLHNDITKECHVLYAGALTKEKGWHRVMSTMQQVAAQLPDTCFYLDVITRDALPCLSNRDNLHVQRLDFLSFEQFCQQIVKYDLFLDLRISDFENTRCLPIKLFYYMACGRPSIYTNLSAIKKGVPEINQCVRLIDRIEEAVDSLKEYICNASYYNEHCRQARQLAATKYNWSRIKMLLLQLVNEV